MNKRFFIALIGVVCLSCNKKPADVNNADYNFDIDPKTVSVPVDSTRGRNVYYFGDSIVQGAYASDPSKRWTTVLSAYFKVKEYNYGVGGTTLEDETPQNPFGSPNMRQRAQSDIPLKGYNDKWLFIAYGANDCLVRLPNYNAANFAAQYNDIIKIALSKNWPAQNIIIIGGYLMNSDLAAMDDDIKQAAKNTAATFNCQYIDPSAYMKANGGINLLYDYVHLVDAGDAAVAQYIAMNIK